MGMGALEAASSYASCVPQRAASQHQQLGFFCFFFLFTRSQTRVYRMGGEKNVEGLKFGLQELAPASNKAFRYRFLTVIILDLCAPES